MSENDEQVDEKEEESLDTAERPDEESVESESPESSQVPAEPECGSTRDCCH